MCTVSRERPALRQASFRLHEVGGYAWRSLRMQIKAAVERSRQPVPVDDEEPIPETEED